MDVWQWIAGLRRELREGGRPELAEAVDAVCHSAVRGDVARAEAEAADLIGAARTMELPWLEVYARHWRLQAWHADDRGATAIREATELFELANREPSKACPQTICVTQDLCIVYGNTDGVGYADERIAVASETIDRIDPSWACFECLSCEWLGGLVDADRLGEAEELVARQEAAIVRAGERPSLSFEQRKVVVLVALGELAEALVLIDDISQRFHPGSDPERSRAEMSLFRADVLSRLGRGDEAIEYLPTIDDVTARSLNRVRWATTVERLVQLGAMPNHAAVGGMVHRLVAHLERNGAWRQLFDVTVAEARMAIARGAGWVAAESIATARRARDGLRVDGGADATLAELDALVGSLARVGAWLPVAPADLVEYLEGLGGDGEDQNAEQEVEWLGEAAGALESAWRATPTEELRAAWAAVVARRAQLLAVCGRDSAGVAALEDFVAAHPAIETTAYALGELLLRRGDPTEVARFGTLVEPALPSIAAWFLARSSYAAGDWDDVVRRCAWIVADDPRVVNTRRLWALAARRRGDAPEALRLRAELATIVPENPADLWELCVDATIAGDWSTVRRAAIAIGMPIDSVPIDSVPIDSVPIDGRAGDEAPIDELWEPVVVEPDPDGAGNDGGGRGELAIRTGPVTARVVSISPTDHPQRVGDLVVFDPAPLNPDADPATGVRFRYRIVHLLRPGGFRSWPIDGFDPGGERYAEFREALESAGLHLWIFSDDGYRITDGVEGEEDIPAIYGRVAAPVQMPIADVDRLLTLATADQTVWRHPLTWLDLATDAGADPTPHVLATSRYAL